MTRARARAMQQKVNSLLSTLDLGTYLDGMLFTSDTLCVIRYIPQEHPDETQPRPEEEEEKRAQPRLEEEGQLTERYYRPGHSGTTAPAPASPDRARYYRSRSSQPRQSGTTAAHQERYYRSSGTTAHQEAVLPLTPEAPREDPQKSSGKST